MTDFSGLIADLPPEQQAIRAKCFHPSGSFVEFRKEEIEQSIPSRFEKIVAQYPDRIAVKTKNYTLTYDALNKMANRIARAIVVQRGEGEEPIALLLENDAAMITAILGVFKTGKICVPLDPAHHEARASYIVEDSQTNLILTNTKSLPRAHKLAQGVCQVINMDEIDSGLSTQNLGVSIAPHAFAYILYTSGSTGQPKGVVCTHRRLLHDVMHNTNDFHMCADDRVSLLSSPGGGQAMGAVASGLLNGATLCMWNVREEGLAALADWLVTEQITLYNSSPTVFRNFMKTLNGNEEFPQLRLVKLGSEPLYRTDVELYRRHFPSDCLLVNNLAGTETGSFRQYVIDKETRITSDIVPVGYTVPDKAVLLLDDDGKEVGFNEIGEIAVKSCYLSPGYWRKPDLTQAKFLPDPNGGDKRIYLTGDLGRMLPDGCLVHLGRKDLQIKIRGNRVEPAEVEMALLGLDGVKEAVVVAGEDLSGNKRLVAYLVPNKQPAPSVSALRRALAGKLPDYMVPSAFVFLEALPLTPNGKIDRRALPAPSPSRPDLDISFVAPRTPIEEELARIWTEVLSVDQVGVHDSFFELGGHSLTATQVISRVISNFRVELPVQSLFEAPTVAEMAVIITQNQAAKVGQEELARMLAELEALSDEEAQQRLAQQLREKEA
jgi:amino acid adenylation domain-containing protein